MKFPWKNKLIIMVQRHSFFTNKTHITSVVPILGAFLVDLTLHLLNVWKKMCFIDGVIKPQIFFSQFKVVVIILEDIFRSTLVNSIDVSSPDDILIYPNQLLVHLLKFSEILSSED